jgi:hypothetical protein
MLNVPFIYHLQVWKTEYLLYLKRKPHLPAINRFTDLFSRKKAGEKLYAELINNPMNVRVALAGKDLETLI